MKIPNNHAIKRIVPMWMAKALNNFSLDKICHHRKLKKNHVSSCPFRAIHYKEWLLIAYQQYDLRCEWKNQTNSPIGLGTAPQGEIPTVVLFGDTLTWVHPPLALLEMVDMLDSEIAAAAAEMGRYLITLPRNKI